MQTAPSTSPLNPPVLLIKNPAIPDVKSKVNKIITIPDAARAAGITEKRYAGFFIDCPFIKSAGK